MELLVDAERDQKEKRSTGQVVTPACIGNLPLSCSAIPIVPGRIRGEGDGTHP